MGGAVLPHSPNHGGGAPPPYREGIVHDRSEQAKKEAMTTKALIGNAGGPCGRVMGARGVGRTPFQERPGAAKCVKVWCGGGKATTLRPSTGGFCRFIATFSRLNVRWDSKSVARNRSNWVKPNQTCGRHPMQLTLMMENCARFITREISRCRLVFRPNLTLQNTGKPLASQSVQAGTSSSADFPQYSTLQPV